MPGRNRVGFTRLFVYSPDLLRLGQEMLAVPFQTVVFFHKLVCHKARMPFIHAVSDAFAAGGIFFVDAFSVVPASVPFFHLCI